MITKAISDRPIDTTNETELFYWANQELLPLLRQMRRDINLLGLQSAGPMSTGGDSVATRLWLSDELPNSATYFVRAEIVAASTDGAQAASLQLMTAVRVEDRAATVIGVDAGHQWATDPDITAAFSVTGNKVALSVTDAGTALTWSAVISVIRA